MPLGEVIFTAGGVASIAKLARAELELPMESVAPARISYWASAEIVAPELNGAPFKVAVIRAVVSLERIDGAIDRLNSVPGAIGEPSTTISIPGPLVWSRSLRVTLLELPARSVTRMGSVFVPSASVTPGIENAPFGRS